MKKYPAKLLLFGEYSVIAGSEALAIPINNFGAYWHFDDAPNESNQQLKLFLGHLSNSEVSHLLDLDRFNADLLMGISLVSNIPQGYGLGSSGSVCAAILDRFHTPEVSAMSIQELNSIFIKMESHFHGTSSGLDPLVSYLKRPVLIKPNQTLTLLDDFAGFHPMVDVYLYDSGTARKTETLVAKFKNKMNTQDYSDSLNNELVPMVKSLIASWTSKGSFSFELIHQISSWQLKNMSEFIPDSVFSFWQEYAKSNDFQFKLCGAGGGGYFLLFAKKNTTLPDSLSSKVIKINQ